MRESRAKELGLEPGISSQLRFRHLTRRICFLAMCMPVLRHSGKQATRWKTLICLRCMRFCRWSLEQLALFRQLGRTKTNCVICGGNVPTQKSTFGAVRWPMDILCGDRRSNDRSGHCRTPAHRSELGLTHCLCRRWSWLCGIGACTMSSICVLMRLTKTDCNGLDRSAGLKCQCLKPEAHPWLKHCWTQSHPTRLQRPRDCIGKIHCFVAGADISC